MNPKTMRLIGIAFMVLAAVVAVFNLRRAGGLGLYFLPGVLIVIGVAFIARSKNRRL
jgi:lipopolysaccharide export LptBFGC system permease protein LptF